VPLVDITGWSKALVEARAAAGTLGYLYIPSDQTHVRYLGASLMAQEAMRALNAQGILVNHSKSAPARVMLDAGALVFGGLYAGNTLDKTFRISPFGDVAGTLTLSAPAGYILSTDGATFAAQASIACDAAYPGSVVTVRFAPTSASAYNGDLTVAHSTIAIDYGNTAANARPGVISLTGNGKVALAGTPATATWPMFSGTTIALTPTTDGLGANPAVLMGLVNKNVANGGARFDTPDGTWPAESARNAARYVELSVPVTGGGFTLDAVSVSAGSGGGSNLRWDIVYALTPDFASPTALNDAALSGVKDTLVVSSYASLGVPVASGQTLYLRVYPYSTTAASSGKSLMLANVVVSGVTQ